MDWQKDGLADIVGILDLMKHIVAWAHGVDLV